MPRKRLGEVLVERGALTPAQLAEGLELQRRHGHRLGAALVAKGYLSEEKLCQVLGEALALEVVDLEQAAPIAEALALLRPRFCEANELIPLSVEAASGRKLLRVALADPLNLPAIEEIEFTTGMRVKPVLAGATAVHHAIRKHYYKQDTRPRPADDDKMILVRPGGAEMVEIDYSEPLPVADDDVVPLTEEVTTRTELAELIRQRAEARTKKRGKAGGKGLDADLNFLFGAADATTEERLARLERKMWAVLRLMAKKGVVTKEEFLAELDD